MHTTTAVDGIYTEWTSFVSVNPYIGVTPEFDEQKPIQPPIQPRTVERGILFDNQEEALSFCHDNKDYMYNGVSDIFPSLFEVNRAK